MKTLLTAILSAAFLAFASQASASNPAPGVQILVKKGSLTVFTGITDGTGNFFTAPLERGVYLFEVRGPKVVGPTRYFLALAGARPAGETLTNAAGDLAMQAEVRQPRVVRGQVRATRTMRLPAPAAPATGIASEASGGSSTINPVTGGSTAYRARSTQSVTMNAAAPASNRIHVAPATRTSSRSFTAAEHPTAGDLSVAGPVSKPSMIGRERYVWKATTSGSNLGRWVLDARHPAARRGNAAARQSSSGR